MFPNPRNGCNTIGPQVMSGYLDKDYLYGVHILLDSDAVAFRWHEPTDTYETILLSDVVSNQLELPLFLPSDDHYALAVGVDNQDTMYIVGNHHEGLDGPPTKMHFIKCDDVTDFENPASWSAQSTSHYDGLDSIAGASPLTYTYDLMERLSDGTLLHFLSQSDTNPNTRGRDWLAFKCISGTWTPLIGDGHFATTEAVADGTGANRAYINGLHVEKDGGGAGVDRVHVYGIWRTEDEDPLSQKAPYYLYSDNLTTWKYKGNPDGTQTMPITWDNRSNAEISSAPSFSRNVRMGVYVDGSGYPAIIVREEATSTYVRLYWNGTAWATEDYETLNGEVREFRLKGQRYVRYVTSLRVAIKNKDTNKTFRIGNTVQTSGATYSPNHDPVWLRERGVYAVNIGSGDTPRVFTFGNGSKRL